MIPFELLSIDDAPEGLRDHYVRHEDGERVVWRLEVSGHVAEGDVGRLRLDYATKLAQTRAALDKANAALKDLDASPVTIDQARADAAAMKRARRELDDDGGSGNDNDDDDAGDDDADDDAAALLAAAKREHGELETKLAERRLRDEVEPRIAHVRSRQLREDILRIAVERYRVGDDGKVIPIDSADETFEHFIAAQGGTRLPASRGGGAGGAGGRRFSSPNPTVEAFRAGRGSLTEVARAARQNPSILPDVQRLLGGK